MSTVVSETVLLGLYGAGVLGAAAAAVAANVAGVVPSYAMSRYWIWPEADRRRAGRQAGAYWLVSLIGLGASTVATGLAEAVAPGGRSLHTAVVGVAYVASYGALWLAKFLVYQRFVFPARPGAVVERARAAEPPA